MGLHLGTTRIILDRPPLSWALIIFFIVWGTIHHLPYKGTSLMPGIRAQTHTLGATVPSLQGMICPCHLAGLTSCSFYLCSLHTHRLPCCTLCKPSSFLPQSLCICCFLLECWLLHFLQDLTQKLPTQWGFPWSPYLKFQYLLAFHLSLPRFTFLLSPYIIGLTISSNFCRFYIIAYYMPSSTRIKATRGQGFLSNSRICPQHLEQCLAHTLSVSTRWRNKGTDRLSPC